MTLQKKTSRFLNIMRVWKPQLYHSAEKGGGESLHVPRIHMQFESHEEAHAFYNNYALIVGFSTIKLDTYSSREKGASREVTRRMYKCNRRGNLDHQDNG